MQTEKLIEAIEIAKGIIDYCGGDAWERECTQESRDRFQEIYEELFPTPVVESFVSKRDWRCDICGITMPKGNRESHINGKKHKAKDARLKAMEWLLTRYKSSTCKMPLDAVEVE